MFTEGCRRPRRFPRFRGRPLSDRWHVHHRRDAACGHAAKSLCCQL